MTWPRTELEISCESEGKGTCELEGKGSEGWPRPVPSRGASSSASPSPSLKLGWAHSAGARSRSSVGRVAQSQLPPRGDWRPDQKKPVCRTTENLGLISCLALLSLSWQSKVD